jgi:hypothetical protein
MTPLSNSTTSSFDRPTAARSMKIQLYVAAIICISISLSVLVGIEIINNNRRTWVTDICSIISVAPYTNVYRLGDNRTFRNVPVQCPCVYLDMRDCVRSLRHPLQFEWTNPVQYISNNVVISCYVGFSLICVVSLCGIAWMLRVDCTQRIGSEDRMYC